MVYVSCEPCAIYQTAEPMTGKQRTAWVRARCAESPGHKHARATYDPEFDILLLELWTEHPGEEGHPRFHLGALH